MKMRRMAGVGIAASALMVVAACGSDGGSGGESGGEQGGGETSAAPSSSMSSPPSSMSKAGGVTTAEDVYGPACGQVPKSGEGSVGGMIDDPVATAASNNPLLTKLEAAVKAAGLVDTLNSAEGLTVFAPYDKAFDALGEQKFNELAGMPDKLGGILKYHVVPQRMDAAGLAEAGEVKTLAKAPVKIEGSGQDITVNGNKVLCGNVPTANATVFVIDKVMTPPTN